MCRISQKEENEATEASRTYNVPLRTLFRKQKEPMENISRSKCGKPTVFMTEEESSIEQHLVLLGELRMPINTDDLKICVKNYLEEAARVVSIFKENIPSKTGYIDSYDVIPS